jgi:ubiquinone/menaquinone biosynthesis C-methylase UbiE
MKNSALKTEPFESYATEYDEWFDQYPFVFKSEVEALREMLPAGESHGIEIGLGTGRFSEALGIKEGIEPSAAMRSMAMNRGIEVMNAVAEKLPYKDLHFDFVLIASSISYFSDIQLAFQEAARVLKPGGSIIIGFIERNSLIGKEYELRRQKSKFYKQATFYSRGKLVEELKKAGFINPLFLQTLFKTPDEIKEFEPAQPGYGDGSFIVIKASKK